MPKALFKGHALRKTKEKEQTIKLEHEQYEIALVAPAMLLFLQTG
jgi:hypothetical protein